MKKITKLLALCLLAVTVLGLTACSGAKQELDIEEKLNMGEAANSYFSQIIALSDENVDSLIDEFEYEQNTVMANGFNSWKSAKKELGAFVQTGDCDIKVNSDGSYTMTLQTEFENRDCEFVLGLDERQLEVTELTFNPVYSLGEKMSQAGVNLAVGMGTVFAVLIFLTWIISLFKYISKAQEKIEQKKSKAVITETATKAAPAQVSAPAADSTEIQAVIAAAIAAYESECGGFEKQPALNNGLVIRSYKRS